MGRKNPTRDEEKAGSGGLQTWFASAHRAEGEELTRQIALIAWSPIVDGVLTSVSGLMAVLNEDRQILAVNKSFFTLLGISDSDKVLGLRPGEALRCVHADDNAAGCGTGEFCATCGAAIAIVTALATGGVVERKCILTAMVGAEFRDLCFMVKASPLEIDGCRFLFVFLQDITDLERRNELERAFFHDIKNMVMGLGYSVELLAQAGNHAAPELRDRVCRLADNLMREVKIQSALAHDSGETLAFPAKSGEVGVVMEELREMIANHPAAQAKKLTIDAPEKPGVCCGDYQLVVRILFNMLLNALEATDHGGEIRLWMDMAADRLNFHVWNGATISPDVRRRIFQRYFSTKEEQGRGLGTYSMKFLGEKLLGGKVSFTTSEGDGTTFTLSLPFCTP